jgi:hypothetical protein
MQIFIMSAHSTEGGQSHNPWLLACCSYYGSALVIWHTPKNGHSNYTIVSASTPPDQLHLTITRKCSNFQLSQLRFHVILFLTVWVQQVSLYYSLKRGYRANPWIWSTGRRMCAQQENCPRTHFHNKSQEDCIENEPTTPLWKAGG